MHAAFPTSDLRFAVPEFSVVLLLSAAVAVVAAVIVWLARAPRSVHRHVCRLGRHAARIDLRRMRGPVTVSIRRMDDQHVWIAVDGQAEALVSDDVSQDQSPRPIT
jgi:hypothetical protein